MDRLSDKPHGRKHSKYAVSYQYAPNGVERCSYCSMFKPAASCTEVEGVIDRNGWCQIYRPKSNPAERTASVRLR